MIRLCNILLFSGALMVITKGYNFGYNNSYACHCLNDIQCNEQTGICNNGCSTPWVGTSCQQENIAYNKSANQSGQEADRGPWVAVDGDRSNGHYKYCIDTNYSPWAVWWLVDLGQLFNLRYFKIYYRFDRLSYLKGFSVHIDNELCYQHTGTSNPPAVFPIECNRTITGRYVNISNIRPGYNGYYLSLCEVEIYVCSRGTYGSDCNNFCHCSNYDKCDVKNGQCSNGCQIGWDGDSCSTKCKESYGQDCNKRCIDRKCSGNSTCNHVSGECINGCKPGYHGIDCTQECQGSYGQNCIKQCSDRKCLDQSSCNNIDGQCIGGCQAGYRSLDCTQRCHTGFYGLNCNSSCSERFCKINSTTCHHETGACSQDGCLDYYDGVDCTKYIVSAEESKLGSVESGVIGTVVGILVGFLIGVGVHHCWVTRKQKPNIPEAYYEDITMHSRQDNKETIVTHQTTAAPQILQDNVTRRPGSSFTIDKARKNENLSANSPQVSSDTGKDYYNIQNNTYEELDDTKKQNDNMNDYQSLN